MGVTGLLPQLKDIQESVSLESFRGKTVAIDSYAWLHKSVMTCSWELAQDQYTTRYVDYFRKKVKMLQHFGVKPYFVFDGDNFASKGNTEEEREKNRQRKKEMALELLSRGDKKNAYKYIVQSVDVTPQMAKSVIEFLKQADIPFIVAPYEADPQMVYLEKLGIVDGIISEDSDLLVFGANCLLTKLNDFGECVCIRRDHFKNCRTVPIGLLNDSQLRMVACLSGCDYTDGIPRIGIVTAFKLVKRMCSMTKCIMSIRLDGKLKVPDGFELEYEKADLSFQFQRVFDPVNNEMSTLNVIPENVLSNVHLHECIGPLLDMDIHRKIAHAEVDPITKIPLLSREASLLTQSNHTPVPAKKSYSMPITGIRTSPNIMKRSQTTASTLCSTKNIDAFFRKSSSEKVQRSITVGSHPAPPTTSQPDTRLSPTSKRRRLFNNTESKTPPTNSKFFMKKDIMTTSRMPSQQVCKSPLMENPSEKLKSLSQPNGSILNDLNSSDFDLSDMDDEDDEERGNDKGDGDNSLPLAAPSQTPSTTPELEEPGLPQVTSEIIISQKRDAVSGQRDQNVLEVECTPDRETACESKAQTTNASDDSLDSIVESPTISRRIVGAAISERSRSSTSGVKANVDDVKKGLFERFGFHHEKTTPHDAMDSSPSCQTGPTPGISKWKTSRRSPLEPLEPNIVAVGSPSVRKEMYRSNVTSIKTKRGLSRNFTLDSFAYRG